MTDHRERYDGPVPDPDADRWSAWLPPLDPQHDHTGDADPDVSTTPPLPQRAGPAVPPAPVPAQGAYPTYRPAPPPPAQWVVRPKTHLAMAVVATLLGFTIFGIIAIVKAASVNSLWSQGRTAESARASRLARNWAIAAFATQVLWFAVSMISPLFRFGA